jgi:hypothetical protein
VQPLAPHRVGPLQRSEVRAPDQSQHKQRAGVPSQERR